MAQQPNDGGGKSWERPWSTEEMRKNADKWNLAADAGVLKHLQQFSQVVLNHTHSTEKALDSLLESINTTNANINNVTNGFLCLANTQFLESRVYDDDEQGPVPDVKEAPVEGDLMSKIKSALSVGITLVDTMFEDDNSVGVVKDFSAGVRNGKDPYAVRPLPHLIGSAAFMADDNVGLVSPESQVCEAVNKASTEPPTMDNLSMYSDESILTSSVKRNIDDDSSNTSFCLGDETPVQNNVVPRDELAENDALPTAAPVRSFADELAGKLAGIVSPESKLRVASHNEESYPELDPQNEPSKTKGDMFGVPHSDDEDDGLFSGKSGLFSSYSGRGLFDDLDIPKSKELDKDKGVPAARTQSDLFGSNSGDEGNDDLFAVPAKPSKDLTSRPLSIGDVISQAARGRAPAPGKGDSTIPDPIPDSVPPPLTGEKRIPVGGKSMFGSAGLAITKEALRRRPSSSSSEASGDGKAGASGDADGDAGGDASPKETNKVQKSEGGLFSPNSVDEDDLFQASAPPVRQRPLPQSRPPPEDLEDDLFPPPQNTTHISNSTEGRKDTSSSDFAARQLFDDQGNTSDTDLFDPRPSARPSLFSAVPPPLPKSEDKSKKVSLFDDSDSGDDEFLFSSASSAGSRRSQASADIFSASSVAVATDKKPLRKGLFDDEVSSPGDGPDIDIFRPTESSSGRNRTAESLFEDDSRLSIPPQKPTVKDIGPPVNKFSAAITEDLFSGLENPTQDDLFGDVPEDDLFASKITSLPAPKGNPSAAPVEDLFGTDEGDGDVFVPRKATLTISDPILEKESPEPKMDAEPKGESAKTEVAVPPRPPTTLDIRNTTDPSVVDSREFQEDDEVPPVPAPRHSSEPEEKPRPPEVSPKPISSTPPAVPTVDDRPVPPLKGRTPLAGFGLNINPLALLPGAQPPSKKTPGEEPVGFDQPVENTSTLHSVQKDRVRVSNRRPPSRRVRPRSCSSSVEPTEKEVSVLSPTSPLSPLSPPSVVSPSTDEDDLFGVPQDLAPFPETTPFDGLPGNPQRDVPVDDPLSLTRSESVSETDTDVTEGDAAEDHSSLFAFVKKKPKETPAEFLFSQAPPLPTKEEENVAKVTVDDVEDDGLLFGPAASTASAASISSAAVKKMADLGRAKTWRLSDDEDDEDDDDLFTTGASSWKGKVSSNEVAKEDEPASHKSAHPARTKISQQPPKKTDNLFDDDDDLDDDLFSSASKPPPLPVSKGRTEAVKKTSLPVDSDDDLFDDPLLGR